MLFLRFIRCFLRLIDSGLPGWLRASAVLRLLLTSVPQCFFGTRPYLRQPPERQISRGKLLFFPSVGLDLPLQPPHDYWASLFIGRFPDRTGLISSFCSSQQIFCLRLPSDSTSRWTPLPSTKRFRSWRLFKDLKHQGFAPVRLTTCPAH